MYRTAGRPAPDDVIADIYPRLGNDKALGLRQ